MNKRILPLMLILVLVALVGAGCAEPMKYSSKAAPVCKAPVKRLNGIPYNAGAACAIAIRPFDAGIWYEAPLNSHMQRGVKNAQIGCKPIVAGDGPCVGCISSPGHSNTLLSTFDVSVYPDDITVSKAVLAVYSPDNPQGLYDVNLRGRLNIGDDYQSLAKVRDGVSRDRRNDGWVFYDVSRFVARAIKERRNAVHFEVSVPCSGALVSVGVGKNEPRLIVEYQ